MPSRESETCYCVRFRRHFGPEQGGQILAPTKLRLRIGSRDRFDVTQELVARFLFVPDLTFANCSFTLTVTTLLINSNGMGSSRGNLRFPFSPRYRASALLSFASPRTGGKMPICFLNAAK